MLKFVHKRDYLFNHILNLALYFRAEMLFRSFLYASFLSDKACCVFLQAIDLWIHTNIPNTEGYTVLAKTFLTPFCLFVALQKRKPVEMFYILKSFLRKNHYLYSVRSSYSMYSTSVKTTISSIRKEMKTNCINSHNMCRTYTYLIPFIETIVRIGILFVRAKIIFYEYFRFSESIIVFWR